MREFFQTLWQTLADTHLLCILGGIAILLIGWGVAWWVSRRIAGMFHYCKHTDRQCSCSKAGKIIGNVIFYILLLFVFFWAFSVMHLDFAATPLQGFINTVIGYLPHIAGAALLTVAAWVTASIVRAVTAAVISRSKLESKIAAKTGHTDSGKSAEIVAETLFYVVFLFFIPAILDALEITGITEPLRTMMAKILLFLPNLLAAALILTAGLLLANLVRKAAVGLSKLCGADTIGEKAGLSAHLGKNRLAQAIGIAACLMVALPVVIAALSALQMEALTGSVAEFLTKLLNASGNILGAVLLIFAGLLGGSFLAALSARMLAGFGFDRFVSRAAGRDFSGNSTPSYWAGKVIFLVLMVLISLAVCDVLGFAKLAEILAVFAIFGGNLLLSVIILAVGFYLADFISSMLREKITAPALLILKSAIIFFTVALALGNLNLGNSIIMLGFTLILGAVCVAAAIAFGIGGREAAAKWLNDRIAKK